MAQGLNLRSVRSESGGIACKDPVLIDIPNTQYYGHLIITPVPQIAQSKGEQPSITRFIYDGTKFVVNRDRGYLQLLYRCMLYVRKQRERVLVDDGILVQEFSFHLTINTLPLPKTQVGQKLLTNGYALVAYSIMMARLHCSITIYNYLMSIFETTHIISQHLAQFTYYHSSLGREDVLGDLIQQNPLLLKVKQEKRSYSQMNNLKRSFKKYKRQNFQEKKVSRYE